MSGNGLIVWHPLIQWKLISKLAFRHVTMCVLMMKKMRHAVLKNLLKIKNTQIGIILILGAVLLPGSKAFTNSYIWTTTVSMIYGTCLHFIDKGLYLSEGKPLKIMATQQRPEPIFMSVWTECWGSFHKVHILVIMKQSLAQPCKSYIPQAKVNKTNGVQWNKLLVQQGNFFPIVCLL